MKRVLLIFGIIGLCVIVAIGGNIALVNSHSVLKKQPVKSVKKINYRVFIDATENRLFLYKNDKIIKSYPVAPGNQKTPSPIGKWKIVEKIKSSDSFGGYWMGLNVPWGEYGILGTEGSDKIGNSVSSGCIRMFNDNVKELYSFLAAGTIVEVYGGPYGAFGNGLRTIRSGDRGSDVYEIEKRLKARGYFNSIVNGIYDNSLRLAVHKFQRDNGLRVTDDIKSVFYEKLNIKLIE